MRSEEGKKRDREDGHGAKEVELEKPCVRAVEGERGADHRHGYNPIKSNLISICNQKFGIYNDNGRRWGLDF